MSYYICLDIGGTSIKYGLADETGHFFQKGVRATGLPKKGIPYLLAQITDIIQTYQKDYEVAGAALDTAGIVDAKTGVILMGARNFPGYTGTNLKQLVETTCRIPCTVENDVNAAGLGEYWLGAGQKVKSLVCITVGTGIGGCVILNGHLLRGISGSAGEIGYMRISGTENDLEASAAVPWLIQTVAEVRRLPPEELNGEKIFNWAKQGDVASIQAIDIMLQRLAAGIGNICCLLNPELILLGGGIMAQQDYLRPRLEASLLKALSPQLRGKTRIDFARLGNDAGMTGALRNFLDCR